MNLREKVARAIAKARTDCDPDTLVIAPWPRLPQLRDGHGIAPTHSYALYLDYLDAADAALTTIHNELKAAGILIAWPEHQPNSRTPDNP